MRAEAWLTRIEPGGVAVETELGEEFELEADAVVLVTQRVSHERLYLELTAAGVEGVHRIGDCVAPRLLADAIWDGHRMGREIDSPDPSRPLPHLRERPGFEAVPLAGGGAMTEHPALTYSSYLHLDELLACQQPVSEGPEHDELLFIVIHQVYELWFKLLLHELRPAAGAARGRRHRRRAADD